MLRTPVLGRLPFLIFEYLNILLVPAATAMPCEREGGGNGKNSRRIRPTKKHRNNDKTISETRYTRNCVLKAL